MSCDGNILQRKRFSRIENLKWDISEIFTDEWNKILESKRKEEKWLLVFVIMRNFFLFSWIASFLAMTESVNLNQSIRIEVIGMGMRDIDSIDG